MGFIVYSLQRRAIANKYRAVPYILNIHKYRAVRYIAVCFTIIENNTE